MGDEQTGGLRLAGTLDHVDRDDAGDRAFLRKRHTQPAVQAIRERLGLQIPANAQFGGAIADEMVDVGGRIPGGYAARELFDRVDTVLGGSLFVAAAKQSSGDDREGDPHGIRWRGNGDNSFVQPAPKRLPKRYWAD